MPRLIHLTVAGLCLLGQIACGKEETATANPILVTTGFNNLYSPFQVSDRIWLGGWSSAPEQVPWPDKIYLSRRDTAEVWSSPEPIRWAAEQQGWPPGEIPGLHINDPVVLVDSPRNRWIMLYTAFPNDAVQPNACNPQINPVDCLQVERHYVGWLVSSDAGETWRDRGIVLQSAGGVWSPGAIQVGNEIWMYFMDATMPMEQSSLWRQRLLTESMQPIDRPTMVVHPGDGLSNADVVIHEARYYLVGNRRRASAIYLYVSSDGLHFRPPACWTNPVVSKPNVRLDGPQIVSMDPLNLLAGFNTGGGSDRIVRFLIPPGGC